MREKMRFKECVRIPRMTLELSYLLTELNVWERLYGEELVVTGIGDEDYRVGGAHYEARAVDIRINEDPESLVKFLKKTDVVVLYGDEDHKDHIHVHVRSI